MRRIASMVLVVCFALLGTGVIQHLHLLQHEQRHSGPTSSDRGPLKHSDSNCPVCVQLHQPVSAGAGLSVLAGVALLTGSISPVAPTLIQSIPIEKIDCRGPPRPFTSL